MSKQQMPIPSGGSLLPKLIGTAVVLALLVMVIRQPVATAGWLEDIFGWALGAIEGIAAFFGEITA